MTDKLNISTKDLSNERKGDYLGTFTGRQFWPLDPRPEEICLEDIAHALSQICRFNGHTTRFYSVAEHCLNVRWLLEEQGYCEATQLYGLLHDAAEAYVCDIPRPLKKSLPGYEAIETDVINAVYKAFGLKEPSDAIKKIINWADNYILALEAREIMIGSEGWNMVEVHEKDKLGQWSDIGSTFSLYCSYLQGCMSVGGIV